MTPGDARTKRAGRPGVAKRLHSPSVERSFARWCGVAVLVLALGGCVVLPAVGALAEEEVAAAVTQQLDVAVSAALHKLGAPGGFELDPAVHVPLPPNLRLALPLLQLAGFGPQLRNSPTSTVPASDLSQTSTRC